jgi:TatD DNase family protein
MLTDTHCHLGDRQFDADRNTVVERACAAGVRCFLTVGYDIPSSQRCTELAASIPGVFAVAGVHPHDAAGVPPDYLQVLRKLADEHKVVAIGEIGLDFYRDLSPRVLQREVFTRQLGLARELKMPVVIHCRDSMGEVYDILSRHGAGLSGVMHCFSGNWEEAEQFLAMGFYISIAGPVTFGKSGSLTEVAEKVPLDRLLLETDALYLAPVPCRGKRNEPAYLVHTARRVAEIRRLSFATVAAATSANAARLFKWS